MANYPSAIRRIRKSRRAQLRNKQYRSRMRSAIKKVLETGEKSEAEVLYRQTTSLLDKLVSKGIIHKNKAANQKSRLAGYVNSLS